MLLLVAENPRDAGHRDRGLEQQPRPSAGARSGCGAGAATSARPRTRGSRSRSRRRDSPSTAGARSEARGRTVSRYGDSMTTSGNGTPRSLPLRGERVVRVLGGDVDRAQRGGLRSPGRRRAPAASARAGSRPSTTVWTRCRQRDARGTGRELGRRARVVARNGLHRHEQDRGGEDDDPGARGELGHQDDDEDERRGDGPEPVDEPLAPQAPALGPRPAVPISSRTSAGPCPPG